jgi:hypothetical protein
MNSTWGSEFTLHLALKLPNISTDFNKSKPDKINQNITFA